LSRATAQRETLDWFGSLGTIANNMSARETAEFILAEQRTWWPIAHRLKE
jgi:hypothetical protein